MFCLDTFVLIIVEMKQRVLKMFLIHPQRYPAGASLSLEFVETHKKLGFIMHKLNKTKRREWTN
jgi:hypothetical protein